MRSQHWTGVAFIRRSCPRIFFCLRFWGWVRRMAWNVSMDNSWRTSLAHESRQKIVKRIMDTLQRHTPDAGEDGVEELLKTAWGHEEKAFQAATDQRDYLRQISLKMLSLETMGNGNPTQARPPTGA